MPGMNEYVVNVLLRIVLADMVTMTRKLNVALGGYRLRKDVATTAKCDVLSQSRHDVVDFSSCRIIAGLVHLAVDVLIQTLAQEIRKEFLIV